MAQSPYYRFFRRISFPIPFKEWEKLPRITGYKNEYWDGCAQLSARPNTCDMLLDLTGWPPLAAPEMVTYRREEIDVRPLGARDWVKLPQVFLTAFGNEPPLSGWGRHAARRAARCIIEWARLDRDGKLVPSACFAAWTSDSTFRGQEAGENERICGACIVGLVPVGMLGGVFEAGAVPNPEHPDDPGLRLVPHLDWVFVNHRMHRQGIGTMLLESVVSALRASGFRKLASTSLLGNSPSLLWHWRNGFVLVPNDFSFRRRRRSDGRE